MAERLLESHPGKKVAMMSYILTAAPPKTFTTFPVNTKIMLTGTNEEDIAPWREYVVPGGFTGYLYNWCPNLGTRYTPMRTPGHVATQAKRLAENHIQSFYRDGPGSLYGQLYHNLTLYSDFLGTRSPAWTYEPIEGRRRKMVTDPFQLISYLCHHRF